MNFKTSALLSAVLFLSTNFAHAGPQTNLSKLTDAIMKAYAEKGSESSLINLSTIAKHQELTNDYTEKFLLAQPVGSELRSAVVISPTYRPGELHSIATGEVLAIGGWNQQGKSMKIFQIFAVRAYPVASSTDIDLHLSEVGSRIKWLLKDLSAKFKTPLVLANANGGAANRLLRTVDNGLHKAVVEYKIEGIDQLDKQSFERLINGLSSIHVNY